MHRADSHGFGIRFRLEIGAEGAGVIVLPLSEADQLISELVVASSRGTGSIAEQWTAQKGS